MASGREQESINLDLDLDDKVNKMIAEGDKPLEVAEKIAAAARANAPVGNPATDPNSGKYAAGISAMRTPHGARVVASDNKSSWVEFGIPSQNQPAQFNLRRAVDATGYKFKKGH